LARRSRGIDVDRHDPSSKAILEIGVQPSTSGRQDEPDQPEMAAVEAEGAQWI